MFVRQATPDQPHDQQVPDLGDLDSLLPKIADPKLTRLEAFIKSHIYSQFDVYKSLIRKSGYEIGFDSKKACFDHENKKALFSVPQFVRLNATTKSRIDFIVMHELGHFHELIEDTEGYLKLIKEMEEHPLGKNIFVMYNCLMDIYVNTNTAMRAGVYRNKQEFSDDIKDFYRTGLYPNRDFSTTPLCFQYARYLLNMGMGVSSDITLSPEVQEVMGRQFKFYGETFNHKDIISRFLLPVISYDKSKGWCATVSQRKGVIDRTIRPIFEELMQKDIEAKRQLDADAVKGPGAGPEGEGSEDGDMFQGIGDYKKGAQKAQDINKEANLTPKEKAERERAKQLKGIGQAHKIPENDVSDFIERVQSMQETIGVFCSLWEKIKVKTTHTVVDKRGYFKTGDTLDIGRAISQFHNIQKKPETVELMYRQMPVDIHEMHPKKMRLIVCVDCSGSMKEVEKEMQNLTIALSASMITRNEKAKYKGEDLRCELCVIGYNGDAFVILPCDQSHDVSSIMKAYSKLEANGGTTSYLAHKKALKELRSKTRFGETDTVNTLIEITDGDTNHPERSKRYLAVLMRMGVFCNAIRIKSSSPADQFEDIWNSSSIKRGYYIDSAKDAPGAISEIVDQILASGIHLGER